MLTGIQHMPITSMLHVALSGAAISLVKVACSSTAGFSGMQQHSCADFT